MMFGLSLVFDSGRKFLLKKNPIAQILKNKAQLSQTGRKSRLLSRGRAGLSDPQFAPDFCSASIRYPRRRSQAGPARHPASLARAR